MLRMKLLLASIALAFLGLNSHASSGYVIDAETGKGVPGAFVFAIWTARYENAMQGVSECYSVATTRADGEGRFELSDKALDSISPLFAKRQRHVQAYAPGYQAARIQRGGPSRIDMKPYAGAVAARLDYLIRLLPIRCASGKSEKRLIVMFEAMCDEADRIAKLPADISHAKGMRRGLEDMKADSEGRPRPDITEPSK